MLKSRLILTFVTVFFLLYSIPLSESPPPKRPRRPPPSPPSPPPPPPPPAPVFELFVLALIWPGSFCALKKNMCPQVNKRKYSKFTIHGMWPSNHTGAQPRGCSSGQPIDWKNDPLMKTLPIPLEVNWPDLKESNPKFFTFFWQSQWNKHGSCSTMGHYDYFNQALLIYDNKDLLPILRSNRNTRPGVNPIQYNDVLVEISKTTGIGKRPQIICDTEDYQKWYIVEVRLCLDKSKVIANAKSMDNIYIDCLSRPPPAKQCPPTVYLSY